MAYITPIDSVQKDQILATTQWYIHQASTKLKHSFELIPVLFDLKGKAAGMYRVKHKQRVIRYNPYLFSKYYAENLAETVPHEVAHYVVDSLYGLKQTQPHGKEWRRIMALFAVEPNVTCQFDLTGIPVRQYQRYSYACACRTHQITRIRHNKILKGAQYHCRTCKQILRRTNFPA